MASSLFNPIFISFISPPKPDSKAPPVNFPVLSSAELSQKNSKGRVSMTADDSLLASYSSSPSSSSSSNELASVICPSLAYSNTLFFNSAYNVEVKVDDNEPEERLVNRLRREVMKAGVKRRKFFGNKHDEPKRGRF